MVRAYFLCDGLVDVNDENDNRELIDDVSHQTLQQEDIEKMRKDGVSGHVIIQELASSSISFEGEYPKWSTCDGI